MEAFDAKIALIAAETDNVVTRADVTSCKGTDEHIRLRLRSKRWQQLHDGVYLLGAAPPTWRQQVRAALAACGPKAVASHETAAVLHGLDGAVEQERIEVTMPQSKRPVPADVHVYRSRRPLSGVRLLDGIRTSSIERCLIDFAAVASIGDAERAVESSLDRKLTTEERIWGALVKQGGRGVPGAKKLRRIMLRRPKGRPAKSVLEIRLGHVLADAGLTELVRNHPVSIEGHNYFIDFAGVEQLLAIEGDSERWHSTASQRARDAERQRRCEAAGWFFIRFTFADVFTRPAWVVTRVRDELERLRTNAVLSTSTGR